MIIKNDDGTMTGGPLDVISILQHEHTGRYHPAFFEESPFPGPVPEVAETKVVRLKSKMHHTEGFVTWEEALVEIQEMRKTIQIEECNVWTLTLLPWDGELGIVRVVPNWRNS